MQRETGQTDNPDDGGGDSTWADFHQAGPTPERSESPARDNDRTIPVSGASGSKEISGGPDSDSGEDAPISSLGSDSNARHEPNPDWDALPPPKFEPGSVVFGKYKLIKILGEGGMGQVWLVENLLLDCKSALKLIKPEIAKSDKAWKRFKREAQVMARLNHSNAVAVRDFARAQSVAYIEMEYVNGISLDKAIEEQHGAPFTAEWVAPLVDQICSVLQEAHDHVDERTGKPRPIIHRDLKPSNLMLAGRRPSGQNLKVLDFGIAKMADDDRDENLTGDAEYIGTAAYSSPEQIRSEMIDGRSDLYSLGVILYQLLTGDLPFQGGPRRSLVAHLMEAPRPFRETNPNAAVPERIEALVLQSLEKNPDLRPRSAREFNDRFRDALQSPLASGSKPTVKKPPIAAIALVCVLGIVGAALFHRGQPQPDKPPKPPVPEAGATKPPTPEPSVLDEAPKWKIPEGFRAVGEGADAPEGPKTIVRDRGEIPFDRQPSGIYLPRGFKAIDPEQTSRNHPLAIRRGSDAGLAVFRRIDGGNFEMGNVNRTSDTEAAGDDLQENPILPHWVALSGYYIQETEVSNGEVEAFLKDQPDRIHADALKDWRRYIDMLKADGNANASLIKTYPAVGLDWFASKTFAEAIGGSLPTEAQWEYAARSKGLPKRFATKQNLSRNAKPLANLFNGLDDFAKPVKTFEKDVTDQSIHDLTGNVREWCRDGYQPDSAFIGPSTALDSALVDPCVVVGSSSDSLAYHLVAGQQRPSETEASSKAKYVVRGGSFLTEPNVAMTIQRDAALGAERLIDLGFRVVIELPILIPPP